MQTMQRTGKARNRVEAIRGKRFSRVEVPQKPKEAISYCKVFVEKVREQLVDIEAALLEYWTSS